jgi:hypothetical protein
MGYYLFITGQEYTMMNESNHSFVQFVNQGNFIGQKMAY